MDSLARIKVTFGDDTRRLSTAFTATMEELRGNLGERYGITDRPFVLKWFDEDGDAITAVSDADLAEAFAHAGNTTLRMRIEMSEQQEKQAPSEPLKALHALASSLELPLPDEMLREMAQKMQMFAPMARGYLEAHAEEIARGGTNPCSMFGMFKGQGMCGPRRCSPRHEEDGVVRHWGVTCDVTGQHPIEGVRFWKRGEDYDLCQAAFDKLAPEEQEAYERIESPRHPRVVVRCGPPPCMRRAAQQQEPSEPVPEGELLPAAPLQPGSHGAGVEQLQRVLISLGLMDERAVMWRAGFFGPRTFQALAQLQQALGEEGDAVYSDKVRGHLMEMLGQPAADIVEPEDELHEQKQPEPEPQEEAPQPQVEAPQPQVEAPVPSVPAPQAELDERASERAALLLSMGFFRGRGQPRPGAHPGLSRARR